MIEARSIVWRKGKKLQRQVQVESPN